jgi:hypothetical protein
MACKQNETWDSIKKVCVPKFGGTTGQNSRNTPSTTKNPGLGKPPVRGGTTKVIPKGRKGGSVRSKKK